VSSVYKQAAKFAGLDTWTDRRSTKATNVLDKLTSFRKGVVDTVHPALSTAWTVAQLWNAHMAVLHVQMDLAPAPAMSAMFQRFIVEHRVKVTEATAGAESATASFLY
jgi:hypothetical protein